MGCSSAAFAGGPGSSPGRTFRRTPIRCAAGRCAPEASAPPGSPSCRFGPGAAGGDLRRVPSGEPRPGAARVDAVRMVDTLGVAGSPGRAIMTKVRPDRPTTDVARLIELSSPRRRRVLRRTGRGSRPQSAPRGSGPDERTRGPERSQVVAGWRALAHETAFAADEPLIVRERGTGCALVEGGERLWWENSRTGDRPARGGPYIRVMSRERAIRTPDEACTPRPRRARRARARVSLRP